MGIPSEVAPLSQSPAVTDYAPQRYWTSGYRGSAGVSRSCALVTPVFHHMRKRGNVPGVR